MNLLIASRGDALRARKLITLFNRPHLRQVSIRFREHDADYDDELSRRLTKHFNDCGCDWAGVAAALTLIVITIVRPLDLTAGGIVLSVIVVTIVAAMAKVASLGWSYYQLLRLTNSLIAR